MTNFLINKKFWLIVFIISVILNFITLLFYVINFFDLLEIPLIALISLFLIEMLVRYVIWFYLIPFLYNNIKNRILKYFVIFITILIFCILCSLSKELFFSV